MAKGKAKIRQYAHFLKEWREARKMTQEELAAAVKPPTNASVISLLENGNRRLSDKWLFRLAPALKTQPGHILQVDPREAAGDLLEIWGGIAPEDKPRALGYLEGLRDKRRG